MDEEEEAKIDSIKKYNKKALSKSIHNQNEAKEITSIMMNKEQGLIRRQRIFSKKFLHDMKVGIVDKQGKPLSKEEYAKHYNLTININLDAPQQENQSENTEAAVKKVHTK